MAQVSDKTLAWLWSVLQNGYSDPQRTYSSAAHSLSSYPSLSPRTEVYTHEHGTSALLLTLSGTLPVAFRGTTYRFPIKLWIPQAYPQEAPLVYVTPGADMVIRPGQHVGVDGRVYHPYLADWARMWDRASMGELLGFLGQVFEREPPVISRAQQAQYQRPIGQAQQQGGAPQPPPKQRVGSPAVGGDVPPPRPPKPGEEGVSTHQRAPSRDVGRDGPPLPPLPHERQASGQYGSPRPQQNGYAAPPRPSSQNVPPRGYQNGTPPGPPLPPVPGQPHQQQHGQPRQSQYERSPVSPVSPVAGYSELPETKYTRPAPLPPQTQHQPQNHYHSQQPPPPQMQGQQYAQQPSQQYQQYQRPPQQYPHQPTAQQPNHQYQQYPGPPHQPQQAHPPKPQPPPDLLTDPFDIALPTQHTSSATAHHPAPAPPIPPNPEKEHLLQALSTTLTHQLQHNTTQNTSFLTPLRAQTHALQTATQTLETELTHLAHLDAAITSNESILRSSIAHCDRIIASTASKPAPSVDEALVVPSVVGTQMWNAVAEAEACREAMDVLQRGVDRGRVGAGEFVRGMRALGRERFLRLAVGRKCARGLGLEVR